MTCINAKVWTDAVSQAEDSVPLDFKRWQRMKLEVCFWLRIFPWDFLDLGFSFCLLTALCSYQFNPFKKVDNWNVIWWDDYIFQPEQPLQPQCTHSTIFPSSNLVFGTRQMQLVEKLVSLVWIQRKQQRFSYPCFFHLAMRFWSAIFSFKQ